MNKGQRQLSKSFTTFTAMASLLAQLSLPAGAAVEHSRADSYQQQIDSYTKALQTDATDEIYQRRGDAFLKLARMKAGDDYWQYALKAIDDYQSAWKLAPRRGSPVSAVGKAYETIQRDDQAASSCLKFLNDAIAKNPKDANAYARRGDFYIAMHQTNEALADLLKAGELDADLFIANDYRLARLGLYGPMVAGIGSASKSIAANRQDGGAYIKRGDLYYRVGLLEKAVDDYSSAIKINARDIDAYKDRADTYFRLGRNQKAADDFTNILELAPNDARSYYNRSLAFVSLGEKDKAQRDRTRAIELDLPMCKSLIYAKKWAPHSYLNEEQQSVEQYSKVLERNPHDAAAYSNRADASARQTHLLRTFTSSEELEKYENSPESKISPEIATQRRYEKAAKDYAKYLEFCPQDAIALSKHVQACENCGQTSQVVADLKTLHKIEPKLTPIGLYSGGSVYGSMSDYDGLIEDCTKALTLDANLDTANFDRGLAYLNLSQAVLDHYEKAAADFARVIELAPHDGRALYYHAVAVLRSTKLAPNERTQIAIDDYTKLIALYPKNAGCYIQRARLYRSLGQYSKAADDCLKAIAQDAKLKFNFEVYMLSHWGANEAAQSVPNTPMLQRDLLAHQVQEKIDLYSKRIEVNPKDTLAYGYRGMLLTFSGVQLPILHPSGRSQAFDDFTKVTQLDPKDEAAFICLGAMMRDSAQPFAPALEPRRGTLLNPPVPTYGGKEHNWQELFQMAVDYYTKAIALNPTDADAYFGRAESYLGLGQYQQAIDDYTKTITLFRGAEDFSHDYPQVSLDGMALYYRAIALEKSGQPKNPDDDDAKPRMQQAWQDFQLCGKVPETHEQGEEIIESCSASIANHPGEAKNYFNRANAYLVSRQYEKSADDYSKVIELQPGNAQAYVNRGVARFRLAKSQPAPRAGTNTGQENTVDNRAPGKTFKAFPQARERVQLRSDEK